MNPPGTSLGSSGFLCLNLKIVTNRNINKTVIKQTSENNLVETQKPTGKLYKKTKCANVPLINKIIFCNFDAHFLMLTFLLQNIVR